jgi:hypothetical protein
MARAFQIGGLIAGIVLVVLGLVIVYMGLNGRNTVHDELNQQQITGTPDMTPAAIAREAQRAGLTNVTLPTCSVANQAIDDGTSARCFAEYMNVHALEATGGKVYSQMPRYATANGEGTNDPNQALKTPSGTPMDNPARDTWVTETALSTALNMSYMADRLSLFSIVTGIALLLTGIGFGVLALTGSALPVGLHPRRS